MGFYNAFKDKLNIVRGAYSPSFINEILEEFNENVVSLITENQLINEGINENNQIIGRYSFATERITNGRKKAGAPFNLKDTGTFHKSIRLRFGEGYFEVYLQGGDDKDLLQKYGDGIIGFTEKSKEIITNLLINQIKIKINKNLENL